MKPAIINRGRVPEIAGSRITVYDVLAETEAGATPEQLAAGYQLTIEQIRLALRFIEENKGQLLEDYRRIKERHPRGDPPDLQAKIDATHAKYAPLWEKLRASSTREPVV